MSRIPILLDEKTAAALVDLARREYRDPRQQAAIIIRQELERRGLLIIEPKTDASPVTTLSMQVQEGENVTS